MANIIRIEVDASDALRAQAELARLHAGINRFTGGVDGASKSGTSLKTVFAGNVLADFFQRGLGAAVSFTAAAVAASAAGEDANRKLEFSATQAGLSYTVAAGQAEDFARRVGASNTEAASTFSSIIQLAERAGRAGDAELIGKRFADLGAARGIKGAELQPLIGTILSGQDEGLNRLGIDDPGKLQEAYAKQIGKTTDALTQQDKARAALNAVLTKGAAAEGQAEERLRSTAGQLDTASASVANLATQFGDSLTNSIEFRNSLDLISAALSSVMTSHVEARRQLEKGLKTPQQLADEASEGTGRRIKSAIVGGFSTPLALGASVVDSLRLGFGQITADEFKAALKGNIDASFSAGKLQTAADLKAFQDVQADIVKQKADAAAIASKPAAAVVDDKALKQAEAARKKFVAETLATRDAASDFLSSIQQRADGENPFTKLFTDGLTSLEKIKTEFAPFGDAFVDEMTRMQLGALDTERALLSLGSQLSATRLQQEARRLEQPSGGLTGPEDRQLDVLKARVSALNSNTGDRREAEALRRGFAAQSAFQVSQEDRALFERILALRPLGNTASALAQQKVIDDQVLEATQNLTVSARFSPDAFTRGLADARATALDARAAQRETEVKDAIAREQAGQLIQTDARELLKQVQASGLSDSAKNKELLAITGSLSEKELTPDLRAGRVAALREGARVESGRESQAEARAVKLDALVAKLDAALSGKGIKVDTPAVALNVQLDDTLALTETSLGPGFTPGRRLPGSDF